MKTQPARPVAPYRGLARAYDAALGRSFFHRAQSAFERLQRHHGFEFRSAADLGCGTGLFARYLARSWGVPVFAVDRSPEMLAQTRRNCRGERVRVLHQDLCELHLPTRVDLITANYDVLNHLTDPAAFRQVLHRVRCHLNPQGHFYFDLITPALSLPPGRWTRWTRPAPGGMVRQYLRWLPRLRALQIDVVTPASGHEPPMVERHQERAYAPSEVGRWLAEAGLAVLGVHDEATLRCGPPCPARVILIARCPPESDRVQSQVPTPTHFCPFPHSDSLATVSAQ